MRKLLLGVVAVAAVMLFSIGTATAAVTWNSLTGTGSVDGATVQRAFGWKQRDLQVNANGVTFQWRGPEQWAYDCTDSNGGVVHITNGVFIVTREVHSTVIRKGKGGPVTSFALTGFGPSTYFNGSTQVPLNEGEPFRSPYIGTVSNVTPNPYTAGENFWPGELRVYFNGTVGNAGNPIN